MIKKVIGFISDTVGFWLFMLGVGVILTLLGRWVRTEPGANIAFAIAILLAIGVILGIIYEFIIKPLINSIRGKGGRPCHKLVEN